MNPSVIVIGAGPGGLASAMLLASAGVKVKLLERMPIVGGRTSAIQTDGFKFDLGPTFFLYPRVLDEIFAAAGASLRQEVELVRLDPQYRIIFGGGGELNATRTSREWSSRLARSRRKTRRVFAGFWKKTEPSSIGCCRAWKTRSSGGRTCSTCAC